MSFKEHFTSRQNNSLNQGPICPFTLLEEEIRTLGCICTTWKTLNLLCHSPVKHIRQAHGYRLSACSSAMNSNACLPHKPLLRLYGTMERQKNGIPTGMLSLCHSAQPGIRNDHVMWQYQTCPLSMSTSGKDVLSEDFLNMNTAGQWRLFSYPVHCSAPALLEIAKPGLDEPHCLYHH